MNSVRAERVLPYTHFLQRSSHTFVDDLNPTVLQTATDLGWTYDTPKDIGRSRTFIKSNARIWSCIHGNKGPMWARAYLVDGRHKDHRYYYELLNALKGINVDARL